MEKGVGPDWISEMEDSTENLKPTIIIDKVSPP